MQIKTSVKTLFLLIKLAKTKSLWHYAGEDVWKEVELHINGGWVIGTGVCKVN